MRQTKAIGALLGFALLITLLTPPIIAPRALAEIKLTPVSQLLDEAVPTKPVDAVFRSNKANKTDKKPTSASPPAPSPTIENTSVESIESSKVDLPPFNPSLSDVKELSKDTVQPSTEEKVIEKVIAPQKLSVPPSPPQKVTQEESKTPPPTVPQDPKNKTASTEANKNKKPQKVKKPKEAVVYHDLPAMVVFPVLRHGNEKAFADVAIVFANEFANKLEKKFPHTRIHNPVYSVEQLRVRGLSQVYNQMMDFYIKAGRPEPKALSYLLDELADDGQDIGRAVFIEADIDLHHQQRSFRPKDVFKKLYMDALPNEQRYYVNSRVKVYDTNNPHHPLVWSTTWSHPVKTTGLYNVTASVYQDSDSLSTFSLVSRIMSRIVIGSSPKKTYRQGTTEVDTLVAGEIYGTKGKTGASSTQKPSKTNPLSNTDRHAIQRLLQKQ